MTSKNKISDERESKRRKIESNFTNSIEEKLKNKKNCNLFNGIVIMRDKEGGILTTSESDARQILNIPNYIIE